MITPDDAIRAAGSAISHEPCLILQLAAGLSDATLDACMHDLLTEQARRHDLRLDAECAAGKRSGPCRAALTSGPLAGLRAQHNNSIVIGRNVLTAPADNSIVIGFFAGEPRTAR